MTLPDGATLLGAVDGYEYLAVEWVYRRPLDGGLALDYYCTRADWPTTPAAQLAARDQVIADLRSQVEELSRRLGEAATPIAAVDVATVPTMGLDTADDLTCPQCDRRCASERGLATHIRLAHGDGSAERVECPSCHKTFKGAAGLAIHRSNCPAAYPTIIPVADDVDLRTARRAARVHNIQSGWTCARCKSDEHAQSIAEPSLCIRCASVAPTNGNGVHV